MSGTRIIPFREDLELAEKVALGARLKILDNAWAVSQMRYLKKYHNRGTKRLARELRGKHRNDRRGNIRMWLRLVRSFRNVTGLESGHA